jgi:hypothetical protein
MIQSFRNLPIVRNVRVEVGQICGSPEMESKRFSLFQKMLLTSIMHDINL